MIKNIIMKNFSYISLVIILIGGQILNATGQTPFWSEDFSSYAEDTGITGPGETYSGDYPAGVTKWSLDVSSCNLSNADDYIKTNNWHLETRDLDGPAEWISESIDISAYSSVVFSVKAKDNGSMEQDDYFDVYYQVDGGAFSRVPNWNGLGNNDHTLIDDFGTETVSQTITSGSSLIIKVVICEDSGFERHELDDVEVFSGMEYISSTVEQNTANIAANLEDQQIIGIRVITTGIASPLDITQFTVNANGSSTPVSNNIENARIYYTGIEDEFEAINQFGSDFANPTVSDFTITGNQQLSEGTNYFWLTVDAKAGAITGEVIDAECVSFIIDGNTVTPTVTAPSGNREISEPLSGTYVIGAPGDYSTFTGAVSDLNNLGISSPVTFEVETGTYTEQISLKQIAGSSAADTVVFKSASGDPTDVILQYEPANADENYVVQFSGSDYVSFVNMTFQNIGSSSFGRVLLFNNETSNVRLKGNYITGRDIDQWNSDFDVIYCEDGPSNMATNVVFENDTIRYGSSGLVFRGDDENNLETGLRITNSVIEDYYFMGISLRYQDSIIVYQNKISSKGAKNDDFGIYLWGIYGGYNISSNRIFLSGTDVSYGMRMIECYGSPSNPALISNNFFSQEVTNGVYSIYIESCGYQNLYHNTINHYSSTKINPSKSYEEYCLLLDYYYTNAGLGNIRINNNIVNGGSSKVFKVSETAVTNNYLQSSDNNDFNTSSSTFGEWGTTTCTELNSWQTASGLDANSIDVDPGITSNTDPTPTNTLLKGSVPKIPEVNEDINELDREDPTTPGAVETTGNVAQDITWTGNKNSDWNDPDNWNPPVVPDWNDNVFIGNGAPNYPEIHEITSNGNTCNNLTIYGGGKVTLYSGVLHIHGNLNSSAGDVLQGGNGKMSFTGSSNASLNLKGYVYPEISIDKDESSSTVTLQSDCATESFDLNLGTVDVNGHNLEITMDLDFSGGAAVNLNEIEFSGSTPSQVNTGTNSLQDVKVNKDAGVGVLFLTELNVRDVQVEKGNLDMNNNNGVLSRTLQIKYAAIIENTDELRFTGSENSDITTNGNFLKSVIVDKDGNAVVSIQDQLNAEALEIIKGRTTGNDNIEISNNVEIGTASGNSAIIEINPDGTFTVTGNTTINNTGELKLKSDATGTGGFLPKGDVLINGNGNFSAERFFEGQAWHLISPPISDATAQMFLGDYLQYHTETNNSWTDITDEQTSLSELQGYSLWTDNPGGNTALFEGTPNFGNATGSFTYSGNTPAADFGWNLVGNPFTCPIDWTEVNIPANLDAAIYRFDPNIGTSGDYVYYLEGSGSNTSTQYIDMAQGFFVHCSDPAGGALTITPDAMTTETATFYKMQSLAENALIINVAGHPSSKAEIRFLPNATKGFDSKYDVYKLFSESQDVPAIFSRYNSLMLAVNSLPSVQKGMVIPVGFSCGSYGTYTFEFTGVSGFDPVIPVYLEDKKENNFVNLREIDSYDFEHHPIDEPGRFKVHFNEPDPATGNKTTIYSAGSQIVINNPSQDHTLIEVYNVMGQQVRQLESGDHSTRLQIGEAGTYLVRVVAGDALLVKKVVVR